MRFRVLLFVVTLFVMGKALADEGMWLPSLLSALNQSKMRELGFELTKADIYNVNQPGLKDAVVAIERGSCTGGLVSPEGLFFTNHHCGFGEIQKHSSEDNNILKNGFWAETHEQELVNPGKTVTFLIRVEDVSDSINSYLSNSMDENERERIIDSLSLRLEVSATEATHYDAQVKSFYSGNRFYLFVTETFRDVRLVGTPPNFIGKFGGDTDNWVWPRHTGDFSLFRIYTAPNGDPADYSEENIPLIPKHFFPVSLKGYSEGDFSMILGYPGSTNRYQTSGEIKFLMENLNDVRIRVREKKLGIIRDYMATGEKATIQYAAKHNRSSNYYKYSIGQNRGIERLKVIEKKKKLEEDFIKWLSENEERKSKYGQALSLINEALKTEGDDKAYRYLIETFLSGIEIIPYANRFTNLKNHLKSHSNESVEWQIEYLKEASEKFFRDYNPVTDQKLLAALSRIYAENVDHAYHPEFIKEIEKRYNGNFEKWAEHLFAKSMFNNEQAISKFLNKPRWMIIVNDPVYKCSRQIYNLYKRLQDERETDIEKLEKGKRLFIAGIMDMYADKELYPDANSTMRLTYGTVGGYFPSDAVEYNYFTTHKGYLEKSIPGDREFDVWPEMVNLLNANDFGQYADRDGSLHTCFITNNDITGGNSGSPVLNNRGELIGIAFDGNWEAMSGDVAFEPDLQKCICVDIRFVLWVMEKFSGATHLIDEMTILN
ncbi:MAG: S46 family peptidase [Prolixibacteraceae bacterium]|nr:S46 family peptidase [Prolixibacteraceae bacterium]